jgi:hypothetical protein
MKRHGVTLRKRHPGCVFDSPDGHAAPSDASIYHLNYQALKGFDGIHLPPGRVASFLSVVRTLASRAFTASVAAALGFACVAAVSAQEGPAVPLVERARGAEQIILGRVASVSPEWRVNDFGDRLIVSIVRVSVDETLKGFSQATVDVEVEGGTIGSLTLHVSDQQSFMRGDRAVFYLARSRRGTLVPHLRGQGTLKLDQASRVPASTITLDEIRRAVAAARAQP